MHVPITCPNSSDSGVPVTNTIKREEEITSGRRASRVQIVAAGIADTYINRMTKPGQQDV